MYKIKTYDKLADIGYKTFDSDNYSIKDNEENPDGILVHSTPLHNEKFNDDLKAIVRIGAGVNTIPVDKLTNQGVCVFNCPGGNANAVKELTIASMIMLMRNGFTSMEWVKSLTESETEAGSIVEKGKSKFKGPEIMGKTIGVIGVGAIGSLMVQSCRDLGMKVLGYDPYLGHARAQHLSQYVSFVELDELLAKSDVITIHIPYNENNKNFIDKEKIDKMKDDVYLINYARGQIIDNKALCDALDSGKVKGYATDFPTPEEIKRSNVIYTPHLGAGTPEADMNCSVMAAHEMMDYLENGNITNSVNYPDVSFARTEGPRVCVIHENKVGMLGKMTDYVVSKGLNIENLVNKARGKIAYTIMDFIEPVSDELQQAISSIDGVIRVRIID